VYCQLVEICGCIPARIRHALADLPETLDETYERTLREINKANREFAHRLFQFVAVAVRPLRVEELAELLAFDFEAEPIPKFHEDWRLEDPIHAVLSTCPSFLAIVDDKIYSRRKVVQFSHFSVKEFLTSARLAEANDIVLRRYHISETPAHTLAARACLGYLLHLDKDVTRYSLRKLPFTRYSAEYWVDHARLEDVSRNVKDGLKELFNPSKPHLAVCIWIRDKSLLSLERRRQSERPPPLRGTPLHYAAVWGLHSIIELLVNEHSQNVNSQDFPDSATPLHVASRDGHMKIARQLLECNADVKAQNKDKETPLHVALKRGHVEVAGMLIGHCADVSARDKESGRLEVARMLIERGASVSAQDKDGETPLHLVFLFFGNWQEFWTFGRREGPEVARTLIECGASVSTRDKDGQTPLHLASQAGPLDVVRIMIERSADVSAQNKDGQTPLHLAFLFLRNWYRQFGTFGRPEGPEVARMLIERGASVSTRDKDGQTPLHLALQAGPLDVVCMLIERGADVSAQNEDGQTPLHLVLLKDWHPAIMPIERDASVPAQNKDGQTPLYLALQAGPLDVFRMMIERGADVSARDKDGHTPLHLALQAGLLDVVFMLIERGADVSARDKDGHTPLHLALQAGLLDVVFMLIERGTDVSAQNEDGQTPLHLASQVGPLNVVRMLIARGADVSAQDKDGQTPLHLASQAEELEIARMLIEHGADVSAQNEDGQTPLLLVILGYGYWDPFLNTSGHQEVAREVARILIEHGADVSGLRTYFGLH
jgi:ankyrin repeat protein